MNAADANRADNPGTTGVVFDVRRSSPYAGPGLRTAILLKGCALRCKWCRRPEAQELATSILYTPELCNECGECSNVGCPQRSPRHTLAERLSGSVLCDRCGRCAAVCPTGAISAMGSNVQLQEAEQILSAGDAVTLSGGEPMLQFDFSLALLAEAKRRGLHSCLETSGFGTRRDYLRIAPVVDLFLWDVKDTDPVRHRSYTGALPDTALANLRAIDASGIRTRLRCLIIDGINSTPGHVERICELFHSLDACEGVELLPFRGPDHLKRERLGLPEPKIQPRASTHDTMEAIASDMRASGVSVLVGPEL